jgi:hypothetical protein
MVEYLFTRVCATLPTLFGLVRSGTAEPRSDRVRTRVHRTYIMPKVRAASPELLMSVSSTPSATADALSDLRNEFVIPTNKEIGADQVARENGMIFQTLLFHDCYLDWDLQRMNLAFIFAGIQLVCCPGARRLWLKRSCVFGVRGK